MTTIGQNQNSARKKRLRRARGSYANASAPHPGDLEPADSGGNECAVSKEFHRLLGLKDMHYLKEALGV
jgi:hypothetical protein